MNNLNLRLYAGDADYWRLRSFLRATLLANHLRQHSWDVCRFDYWRWHGIENIHALPLDAVVWIWETPTGQIAAALTPEGMGEAFLHVHPSVRSAALEEQMLACAEEHLAETVTAGGQPSRRLKVWAHDGDTLRTTALQDHGYTRGAGFEAQRRRPLSTPIPDCRPPAGFHVRSLGGEEELPARSWLSWRGFHPDEPDERYEGWEWYRNVQRAPLYRRDLDLVVEAPSGELAAFCTVWLDDACQIGLFEPVATHPDYLRRGLGSAVMAEGLRRLQHMGAVMAYVGSYSESAGGLYASMGFTEYDVYAPYEKTWAAAG